MKKYQYRVLPCPNFSVQDRDIIMKHGFLTWPAFIDNGFKAKGGIKWKKAVDNAKQYRPLFFLANDNEPLKNLEVLSKWCGNIILPLHKKKDLATYINDFEWIGFPNNPKLRDFDIYWFLKNTQKKKRWWLGVHEYPITNYLLILKFQGLDSTLPELYAGKYGKVWTGWRDTYKPPNQLHWRVIFEMNVQNFQLFLNSLDNRNHKQLTEFINQTSSLNQKEPL